MQCQSGHIVCQQCRSKLSMCPTCRGPLGNIRNLAMEKVASTVMFPCKYSSSGCPITLLHTDKTDHEETCEFRPYCCPCPGASCKWQGSLEQVMTHLMQQHKSITTLQGEDIVFLATDINLPGAVDWVMMQSCFGHNFMLVLEKQEKMEGQQIFYAIVQLIGTRKQAENFAYRLELNGHRRRLSWEATPRSIHDGVQSAIMASDCLVFDTNIAQLFADHGNLGINMPNIKLQSIEGQLFDVDVEIVRQSVTIKTMLEDLGVDDDEEEAVPLPNVNAAILTKVINWCTYHKDDPPPPEDDENKEKRTDDIGSWDADFLKVDQGTLFELILAANYLDIKGLLDVTCKTVANMIKGKSPEEIRKTFNIKNDFTPAEEEQVRKENEWCEEK
ncbi:hypothetical protein FSP39_024624 [Pinctada imbricata]|uniref:E3 ubiquitin-protein ligase n=2 Tax=Pteriomorphia TaxID=6545 RepID=A0AA88YM72_PINIB|nr:hypothetical protein FSP39_024624 [Pinctada imbricata]